MRGPMLVALLVLGGSVGGCGDDNDSSSEANSIPTSKATQANKETAIPEGRLVGPQTATVGEPVTIRGSGFPPGRKVEFVVDPTKWHEGGAGGVGIIINGAFSTTEDGRLNATFSFPAEYCSGTASCNKVPFEPGMNVTLVVSPLPSNDVTFDLVAG